ncbi:beta-lactamase domain protein [Acidimicrobium ferrooxidans DSM 10331]|uniref:Beta-lactamase domain protein n=1 Tax=Acidimicrobium ferrooxidans (strain DSM 10331 / JCM 15462 / NBRC 103882 / ICP) TaxID=525909 RepID=C7LXZ3_ACIFD|nr:ribonuclease J [Acidimicrobium ferrooxidans]ACU53601.1 beta-lactamase domain protein [Acidimicrobium ferrooxidans DSM 10331]
MSRPELHIRFLGGLGEIGRNAALVSVDGRGVLIDFGVMFPKADMPGVDLVLPNLAGLDDVELEAVIVTHGHEDHIGGLPFLLAEHRVPVWGSEVTLGFVRNRLREHDLGDVDLRILADGARVSVGSFEAEAIPVTHSIPGAVAVALTTPAGVVLHTGDFKIDHTPLDGRHMGLARIAALGSDPGIRVLLSDSTNADEDGYARSERAVGPALEDLFNRHGAARVIVACFSSHLHRIQQVATLAREHGRRLVLLGRSLQRNVQLGIDLGLLDARLFERTLDPREVRELDPASVAVIATGSQGERMAALHHLAFDPARWFAVGGDDVVVFSSDVIPGNEAAVNLLVNQFTRLGATVVTSARELVHATGHAKQEELALVVELARPDYFVPVHGEYRHLSAHAALAQRTGAVGRGVILARDGAEVVIGDDGAELADTPWGEYLYVDGVVGDVSRGVLRERRNLSEEGVVIVGVTLGPDGVALGEPELTSVGWIHDEREEELLAEVRAMLVGALGDEKPRSEDAVAELIRTRVRALVRERTRRRPLVVPMVTRIDEG